MTGIRHLSGQVVGYIDRHIDLAAVHYSNSVFKHITRSHGIIGNRLGGFLKLRRRD